MTEETSPPPVAASEPPLRGLRLWAVVAEIVAASAVVMSLVFVGVQLAQANVLARNAAIQEQIKAIQNLHREVYSNPAILDAFARQARGEEAAPADQIALDNFSSFAEHNPGEDPWHRDGLVFQAISWIAAQLAAPNALTRAPHIRPADKGFDGLQLEFGNDGKTISAVIIFEDKATQNARKTVREEVWLGIDVLEKGERLNELTHEVSALLDVRISADVAFDADAAINSILWESARRYRVSITIDDTHNKADARSGLFKGYDTKAPGDVIRRRAETIYLPQLRSWMAQFSLRVIDKISQHANV